MVRGGVARTGGVGVINGGIGAVRTFDISCDFFAAGGMDDRKMLGVPGCGEGFLLLPPAIHFKPPTPYTPWDEFPCNLNDMRSKNGS